MLQFVANGTCRGSMYALVALGFGLIYGTCGVFHIAHGAVFAVGAYVFYLFLVQFKLSAMLAVSASLALTTSFGILLELIIYRPLHRKQASAAILMISSLGAYIVITNTLALCFGPEMRSLRTGVDRTFVAGGVILTRVQIVQVAISATVICMYWLFLLKTPLGRVCRCVADDSVLASIIGVNVDATRTAVFGIGSLLASIGAILMALDVGIDPHGGFPVVLLAAVACIIGGLHKFIAPAVGSLALGFVQSMVVWQTSAKWESVGTFLLLMCFLLYRPQGIFGRRQRLEER